MENYTALLWIAISVIFLSLLLFIRIKINIAIYADVLNVCLCADLKIYNIRILSGKLIMQDDKFFILTNKEKKVSVDKLLIEKGKKSTSLIGAVKLKECNVYSESGSINNMLALAYWGASLNIVSGILSSCGSKIHLFNSCTFGANKSDILTEIKSTTSLFDILVTFFKVKKKYE